MYRLPTFKSEKKGKGRQVASETHIFTTRTRTMNPDSPHISRRDFMLMGSGAVGGGALAAYYGLTKPPIAPAAPENLPRYVDGNHPFPILRPPYLQENVQLAAFLLAADGARLTALCDQFLNAPANNRFQFTPLLDSTILTYAEMQISSLDERDRLVGKMNETEVGFWMLTLVSRRVGDVWIPDHLAWFMPYLFVDNGYAIAAGREVYGFNKMGARFDKPERIQQPSVSVDVLGFKQFAPDAIAQMEPLLSIAPAGGQAGNEWANWDEAKADLQSGASLGDVTRLLNDNIPLVFLKQFRDATDNGAACYQSLIEAPMKIGTFRGGGRLPDGCQVTINQLESHPIAETLGLEMVNGVVGAKTAVWMQLDFTLGLGAVI